MKDDHIPAPIEHRGKVTTQAKTNREGHLTIFEAGETTEWITVRSTEHICEVQDMGNITDELFNEMF